MPWKECNKLEGLNDRSRRPHRYANQLPFQLEKEILKAKKEKPHWGAPKIREKIGSPPTKHIITHKY